MSRTIPAIEPGSVMINPDHVRELRALLVEVRKQHSAPAMGNHDNSAAVELAGYLRALLGPELRSLQPRLQEPAPPPRPRQPA